MGIQGLLQFVKEAHEERVSVAEYKNRVVGVDISTWIFRGAYACALDLGEGQQTADSYVGYCMRQVQLLRQHGVRPLLVFDGQRLPMKANEHAARADNRDTARAEATRMIEVGDRDGAEKAFQRCISVTPEMAKQVMKACDELKVEFLVAPYEADAQLAFLQLNGHVDAVITEDSDLMVFGCRETLYKFDREFGSCTRIKLSKVIGTESAISVKTSKGKRDVLLSTFGLDEFQQMCILSGCDYLPKKGKDTHIAGIGLKKAAALVKLPSIDAAVKLIRQKQPGTVPEGYSEAVERAERTFKHQIIFDPAKEILRPLLEYLPGKSSADYPFAGSMATEPALAKRLSVGELNPSTMSPIAAVGFSVQTERTVNRMKSHMKATAFTPNRSSNSILKFTTPMPRGGGYLAAADAAAASAPERATAVMGRQGKRPDRSQRGRRGQQLHSNTPKPDTETDISLFFMTSADDLGPSNGAGPAVAPPVVYVSDSQEESSNDGLGMHLSPSRAVEPQRSKRARVGGPANMFAATRMAGPTTVVDMAPLGFDAQPLRPPSPCDLSEFREAELAVAPIPASPTATPRRSPIKRKATTVKSARPSKTRGTSSCGKSAAASTDALVTAAATSAQAPPPPKAVLKTPKGGKSWMIDQFIQKLGNAP